MFRLKNQNKNRFVCIMAPCLTHTILYMTLGYECNVVIKVCMLAPSVFIRKSVMKILSTKEVLLPKMF